MAINETEARKTIRSIELVNLKGAETSTLMAVDRELLSIGGKAEDLLLFELADEAAAARRSVAAELVGR